MRLGSVAPDLQQPIAETLRIGVAQKRDVVVRQVIALGVLGQDVSDIGKRGTDLERRERLCG